MRRTDEMRRAGIDVNADAFLDTVANLVGILVILVVVVASQTKTAAKVAVDDHVADGREKIADDAQTAKALAEDLSRQDRQLQQHLAVIDQRQLLRDRMLLQLTAIKAENAAAIETLDAQSQQQVAQDQQLQVVKAQLEQAQYELADLQAGESESETVVLQHLPTPMARTVFNKEVHVLLKENQLTVIPWDNLIDALKHRAQMIAGAARGSGRSVDTLGPIDGFIMKFALVTERGVVRRGEMAAMAQRAELDYFVLEPTDVAYRESIDTALAAGGRLRNAIALEDPQRTTITVWVYPDSFGTFRELKSRLFAEGYLTAARPMPEGVRVGASPRGSSSTAQ